MHVTKFHNDEFKYSITHWFQPIYNLKSNKIIGYEALLRDATNLEISPDSIFKFAESKGCRDILDMTSIKCAIDIFNDDSYLSFLNIYPSTLLKGNFLSWWDIHVPRNASIVLELLENEPVTDWVKIKSVIKSLRDRGVKLAVDDLGSGYSNIRYWIELEPDYIKLDKYYTNNLSKNLRKQKSLKALAELLSDTTKIIVEGIEKDEDLKIINQLNISYGQGYFLGKPCPKSDAVSNVIFYIK